MASGQRNRVTDYTHNCSNPQLSIAKELSGVAVTFDISNDLYLTLDYGFLTEHLFKLMVFWIIKPYTLRVITNVLREHIVTIFRVRKERAGSTDWVIPVNVTLLP